MSQDLIAEAASALRGNPSVLVCAGSGLSVASGVPTFRGEDGMFRDPDIARLTQVRTFNTDRQEMLSWYQDRRDQLHALSPNAGHLALIDLAETGDYAFATQNVDHLLEAASDKRGYRPPIHHLHGSLLEVRCHHCHHSFEDLTLDLGKMPSCEFCGGPLRPGVVWFGEALPGDALEKSIAAAERAEVCIVVGTSGLVHPAAALPDMARRAGATLLEINPNHSALSEICDILIRDKAHIALPKLFEAVRRGG